MTLEKLDELLISATETDSQELLSEIIALLRNNKQSINKNIKDGLSMIIESWQLNSNNSPNKTKFLVEITQFFDENFKQLRLVLPAVIKKVLPDTINKTTAIKTLKIRDEKTSLSKFYFHYKNLIQLRPNRYFYNFKSSNWGITGEIDWITGSITLLKLNGSTLREVELPVIIDQIYIFDSQLNLNQILEAHKLMPSDKITKLLSSNAYTPIDNNIIKKALFSIVVPQKIKLADFNKWWDNSSKTTTDSAIASIGNCRSITELNLFARATPSFSIANGDPQKLANLFSTIKPTSSQKNYITWVETICLVASKLSPEQIRKILPDNEKVTDILWPQLLHETDSTGLEIWCKIKTGLLPAWAQITNIIKGTEYLTEISLSVPWRCWRAITLEVKTEEMEKKLLSTQPVSNPEALFWIWRNKQKLSNSLNEKLNYTNLLSALSRSVNVAIWEEAKKELKKLILDNKEFQNCILKSDNETAVIDFLEKLNHSSSFSTSEKQSLIVKLSRNSPTLKKVIESGKAKIKTQHSSKKHKKREIHITSAKSYNERVAELNDIINVQMPENTKAIATARAHGDLRENAEYAAAKERQKYLRGRRSQLEIGIATTQPTDFSEINVSNRIIAGSTIQLKYDNDHVDIYHILGSWDSDPEKKYISYETKLGKTLIGKKIGETVNLPNGKTCTIEKIEPLSEKIRKDLG